MLVAVAVLIVLLFVVLFLGLRQVITRPILRLAGEVRQVADQDVRRPVHGSGPREIAQLGADVEAMRQRILDEVAELEQAHAMLDRRTHELERSNADLEQFAYVASHDLQEPLRKVASFCQLLQRRYQGLLDERGEQYIEYAVDGAKRMQGLINDLLAFSRVGRNPGEHVVVDAGRLVDDALANLEVALSLSGGKVDRGELPEVRVEPALMTAVFQNLIGNALKFKGEAPPEVRVTAERDGDDWVFSVSDNGIGIDPEYAERIFALFQRLHTRNAYPGTGIGLALCRRIVEYHGGRIWLDTEAEDTTFRFTLPAHRGRVGTHDARRTVPIDILLVEDDPGDVLMTREAFEHHKIRNALHVVSDGVEALEFLQPRGPVRRRAAAGADPARPQPAPQGRPGAARRDQAGPGAAHHPRGRADDVRSGGGHRAQLRPARQRLRHQAGRLREVRRGGPEDRRVLGHRGPAAASVAAIVGVGHDKGL